MDEELDTSVDTSDVDTSDLDSSADMDFSDDVSENIPEDIPDDIPEEDYSEEIGDAELTEDIEEDTDVPSESDDYSDELPDEVVEDDAETDDIDADEIQEELEDIPEDQSTDLDSGDDLSDDLQDDLPEDISSDASSDALDEDDTVDSIPEDVGDNELPVDDQMEATDDSATDETAEAPTDMEADEQPADVQTDMTDDTAANETTEAATDSETDEQPVDDQTDVADDTAADETSEAPSDKKADEHPADDQTDVTDDTTADETAEAPSDMESNEEPADDQTEVTEDTSADETAETPSDMESNEEPADDQMEVTEDTSADRTEETPTAIESDDSPHDDQVSDDRDTSARENEEGSLLHEYPDEEDPQQNKKASPTTPSEITETWAGIDPKTMPQNEGAQFEKKLNELMESDLPNEEKKQILEDLKEDIQAPNESMTSEIDDGQDDGAPVKVLKKDGGDTSISHYDYEKELADLDEGIKNWGLMQADIARDLAADNERILNDNSLSEIEKQEQLAVNEQKRQLLGQQYDAELSELQREREALAAKVDGNSTQGGGSSSPKRTQSNQKMADGTEQGGDDSDTQARSALRPTDAAFASEGTQSPLSDLQNINRQQLANYNQAEVNDSLPFEKNNIMETNNRLCDIEMQNGLKLEDFSKSEFEKLQRDNPMAANKLMTEFVDRKSPAVDVNAPTLTENGRELRLTDSTYAITDEPCSKESASMKDLSTGKEYTVYPNPLSRISPYDIKQGNNSLGMEQDCGLASGSEAINGLYGKKIASEEFNTDLANKLENFEYAYKPLRDNEGKVMRNEFGEPLLSDEIDWENSGGTNEQNVKRMFDSYNIPSDAFSGMRTPNPEYLAESLKSGDNVVAAVNSDLFWHKGDPRDNPGFLSGMSDSDAQLWKEGKCYADHFVNVYAACYDKETGDLAGFMVKDTGAGRDGMVPLDHFKRAFNGDDRFTVMAQGCVVGRKGGSK